MKFFKFLAMALVAGISMQSSFASDVADYPSKPIKVISSTPPTGALDIIARTISAELKETLKQPVVVESRPGAAGMVAAGLIARAPADGYTIGILYNSLPTSVVFNPNLSFSINDLAPITVVGSSGLGIIANSDRPYKNWKEFLDYIKKNPGKVTYATSGIGSAAHLAMMTIEEKLGIKMLHVPFNGNSPGVMAVLAGEVDFTVTESGRVKQHLETGKLQYLANLSERKYIVDKKYRSYPAINDFIPEFTFHIWFGVFAPAGTPKEIINKLNVAIVNAVKSERYQTTMQKADLAPAFSTVDEFDRMLRNDIAKMHMLKQSTGIRLN